MFQSGSSFIRDQDRVTQFQVDHRVEQRQSKGEIVRIGQGAGLRQLGQGAVTGLALDILNIFFAAVQVSVSHGFGAGVAVDAIEESIRIW